MPVSGQELASLDFGNLIGGPLNAIVEAQAKSAISTANFVKQVGFDKNGEVINTTFKYNRKNDNGSDQQFTLTVPFIMLLPIPYISISHAMVEFNAKITSTTASSSESTFKTEANASAGGGLWFLKAKLDTKTSYQRTSSSSDKEERTFDMHVRVEARNVDMPAGMERVMTLLENSIGERTNNKVSSVALVLDNVMALASATATDQSIEVSGGDFNQIPATGATLDYAGVQYKVEPQAAVAAVVGPPATAATPTRIKLTALTGAFKPVPDSAKGKSADVKLP